MKGFFEHEYLSYKKRHMANLLALAKVDGDFHEAEVAFLNKIGAKYGLKPKHIESILSGKEKLKTYIPGSHEKRLEQLYDLVGMMLADEVIKPNELTFCVGLATKYGYKSEVIQRLMILCQHGSVDHEVWENLVKDADQYMLPS